MEDMPPNSYCPGKFCGWSPAVTGEEMHLVMNIMILSPLQDFGSLRPLLKVSYHWGFARPRARELAQLGLHYLGASPNSTLTFRQLQLRIRKWRRWLLITKAAFRRCLPIPGVAHTQLSVVCFILSGCAAGPSQVHCAGSGTPPQIASVFLTKSSCTKQI